jgi:pimeloyl-ACP methyl ester carboxylesterase
VFLIQPPDGSAFGVGSTMRPRLIFLHGIGGSRVVADELRLWSTALASGARLAGHSRFAADLEKDRPAGASFVYYGDLLQAPHAQGGDGLDLDDEEGAVLAALFLAMIDARLAGCPGEHERRILEHARAQIAPAGQPQGAGNVGRLAVNVATTLLSLPVIRRAGQWMAPKLMARDLAQVARYLARGEADREGLTLDQRIRERLARELNGGPAVVVAHSLGSVVALEALHEWSAAVPLFVTVGSPIGMRTVVWPKLRPQPPRTPESVGRWLNFWDRDDVVAARPHLEDDVLPNSSGIRVASSRVDSDGLWVHPATMYLATPGVAGPIAEVVTSPSATWSR